MNIQTQYTLKNGENVTIRNAILEDALKIQVLYYRIYRGEYPLTIVTDINELINAIQSANKICMVIEDNSRIIGSVFYLINRYNRIAKSFAAAVHSDYRGNALTEVTMQLVEKEILKKDGICDLVYATTRTFSTAPQKLTQNLGYKKMGIFPNVHKVQYFETHALVALYSEYALKKRKRKPILLPELKPLYDIVKKEVELNEPEIEDYKAPPYNGDLYEFEIIEAREFIKNRFVDDKAKRGISVNFYPFHIPNLMLITPDQSIEVYMFVEKADGYGCIIGGLYPDVNYCKLLRSLTKKCQNIGFKYLEVIVDAYTLEIQRALLNSRFLPSAYFPALRHVNELDNNPFFKPGERVDYVVFSRSFQALDFKNLKLEGLNKEYLRYYYNMWKKLYIDEGLDF
ncbi:hypothetical protein KAJ27_19075 [bacterium]|nr:hypothetical protein [bacterium]